jgi:hypothetical protein
MREVFRRLELRHRISLRPAAARSPYMSGPEDEPAELRIDVEDSGMACRGARGEGE